MNTATTNKPVLYEMHFCIYILAISQQQLDDNITSGLRNISKEHHHPPYLTVISIKQTIKQNKNPKQNYRYGKEILSCAIFMLRY